MNQQYKLVLIVFSMVALGVAGYLVGHKQGYRSAEADIKKVQEAVAKKAGEDAAKAANPFQAVNPLQEVETNPFEKTKNILNPFK